MIKNFDPLVMRRLSGIVDVEENHIGSNCRQYHMKHLITKVKVDIKERSTYEQQNKANWIIQIKDFIGVNRVYCLFRYLMEGGYNCFIKKRSKRNPFRKLKSGDFLGYEVLKNG
jgi:hypothetical protein